MHLVINFFLPVIRCPRLLFPEFGLIQNTIHDNLSDLYLEGDRVGYECNLGYTLKGSFIRICLSNGSWSDSEPRCIGM